MSNSIKISEMTPAEQLNTTDLLMISQQETGTETEFHTKSATIGNLADEVVTGIQFTNDLNTNDKTIAGAINEAAAVGKVSEYYKNTNFYSGYGESGGYTCKQWEEYAVEEGHQVYYSYGDTYDCTEGESLCTFTISGYSDVTFFIKQDGADTSKAYVVLGNPNEAIDIEDENYAEIYKGDILDDYISHKFEDLYGQTKTFQVLYHADSLSGGSTHTTHGYVYIIPGEVYTTPKGEVFNNYTSNFAINSYAHAEGTETLATGYGSHAEGSNTTAAGYSSHVEGEGCKASGSSSHAEGSYTVASGSCSHVEGSGAKATGYISHAEGSYTVASGSYSHAEGNNTEALGSYTHTEGMNNKATSDGAHAEGTNNIASNFAAHAEGGNTTASATYSHAEGRYTVASNECAHVEGYYNTASGSYQHVQGKYNTADSTKAFIIGNGTANNARSNALTVDWNGNMALAGDITPGATLNTQAKTICGAINEVAAGGGGTSLNTVTVGTDSSCDYVCDGVADNIQFQQAINTINNRGGGVVLVKSGEYTFNACVNVLSHVHLEMQKDTVITLDDQQIWTLPSTTTAGATTITVSDDILDYIIVGQEVGFMNNETGYLIEGESAHRDFVTAINTTNKTITLYYGCPEDLTFTKMCTLTSGFSMVEFMQGNSNDILIRNGVLNGNIENTTVWINDMCQNGIIIGNQKNVVIDGIEIYGFKFQGIHVTANSPLVSTTRKIDQVDNYTVVKNCYVHDTGFAGICIDSSIWVKVIDCNVTNIGGQGIQLVECCYVDVINCVSTKNSYAGIRAVKSYGVGYNYNFIGNKTSDNAVGFGFASINSSIMSNCISEDDTIGIYFEGDTDKSIISNTTIIGATTGIKEDTTASNNIGVGLNLVNNSTNFNISTMTIINNNSNVIFEKHSDTVIYVKDMNDLILGGIEPDTSLVDDSIDVFDLSLFQEWVVHEGYGYAGEFILEPNTAYTIWSSAPSDTNTLYFGDLDISVESNGGARTVTTDNTGHIWVWIISGRAGTELYRNGTYKVTLVEGTKPFKFIG